MKVVVFTGCIDLTKKDAKSIYIINILKYLNQIRDLEILLLSPNIPNEIKNITHISYFIFNKPHFKFISIIIPSLLKLLTNNCDLIHCFDNKSVSIALVAQKLKRRKAPIIFQLFGLAEAEWKEYAKYSLVDKILGYLWVRMIEDALIKWSDRLIVLSEAMKIYILKKYPNINKNRIFVAPIGVSIELVKEKDNNKSRILIDKLGLNNKKVIMYSGWISPLHGVFDLVKAMELINTEIRDTALVIVGDGPTEPLIRKYIRKRQLNNIIFTGRVSHEEILNYYNIADVLVIPHVKCLQTELNPSTKVLEYFCSGKPIVSSKLKPIVEILGDNAIYVEAKSPKSIAEGVLRVLKYGEVKERNGKNTKELILKYSWEEIAKRIYEAYVICK